MGLTSREICVYLLPLSSIRSWEAELLQGLRRQYQEIKIKYPNGKPINYDASGYHIETGQKIVDLFTRNLENKHRILYLMEIVGPLDHVWMIEQLPNGKGYRIHQSYNNAYSLKAWLSSSLEGKKMYFNQMISLRK